MPSDRPIHPLAMQAVAQARALAETLAALAREQPASEAEARAFEEARQAVRSILAADTALAAPPAQQQQQQQQQQPDWVSPYAQAGASQQQRSQQQQTQLVQQDGWRSPYDPGSAVCPSCGRVLADPNR
ncbi:MAG TPA: hypothetical protein VMA37_16755 [Acetobacteraceae bacterium]|nr:hypothetical protein [Acetobacteraceae bacterium]